MQEEHKKAVLLAAEIDEQNYRNEKERQEEIQVSSCIAWLFIFNLDIQTLEQKWTKAMKAVEHKARLECDAKDNAFQESTR